MNAYLADAGRDRWNFNVLLAQGVAKNVGGELSSEKLVLPYIYTTLGGPALFVGLLIPAVEFSKVVAQVAGATLIELAQRTKWYLAGATTVTALVLAFVSLVSADIPARWLVGFFIAVASMLGLCIGFASLAFQDMLGRVLSERYRGSLLFVGGAVTGVVVVVSALGSIFLVSSSTAGTGHVELIWMGVGMMLLASLVILAVREPAKVDRAVAEVNRKNRRATYLTELIRGMRRVSRLAWFGRYLVARILLLSVELVMPFFAIHAATFHADTAPSLAVFVIAANAGMVLGGIAWPPVSKSSIRLVMSASAILAFLAAIIALTSHLLPTLRSPLAHATMFVLLAFGTQGVVVGRTVYVVGAATDEERPYCIALANVVAGIVGLALVLAAGAISQFRGVVLGLSAMGCMNAAAALYVWRLADVRHPEIAADAE